ncbi:histidinol-phosphatase [Carboxylicivirga linearis]|uniref:Histidinol-phosphatase n=1 Tax=Carboxylicivirga linearis TaxID=1628157 RepID=A0ABS5JSA0_9BACT|nr:histidinol-phosphatase [Carboxylicivirga linearis]MBS2097727.1 histidinol-phosphatase [Carboxylicivirga linearis]
MKYFSFHTHSHFCDGKAHMSEVCKKAAELGLSALGFSSHAPVPFSTKWAMKFEDAIEYRKAIAHYKDEYKNQLDIYAALEADYIPLGKSINYDIWRQMLELDYIIGSVHLVMNPEFPDDLWFLDGPSENYEIGINECFGGDVKKAVRQYYHQIQEMVRTQKPDVIAHMDKVIMNNKGRFFREEDKWYQELVEQTLQVIADSNTIIEVNTRGIYRGKYHTFFPNEKIIKRCVELDIPLTISVDAHHPDELKKEFDHAVNVIKDQGGNSILYFNQGQWEQLPIDGV